MVVIALPFIIDAITGVVILANTNEAASFSAAGNWNYKLMKPTVTKSFVLKHDTIETI